MTYRFNMLEKLKSLVIKGDTGTEPTSSQSSTSIISKNDCGDNHNVAKFTETLPDSISVFPFTDDPTRSWELLSDLNPVIPVKPLDLDAPRKSGCARFVCISDIHGQMLDPRKIPDGDVLIVAGDLTNVGHPIELRKFNEFLGKLSHPHKLVIAGNHDLTLDADMKRANFPGFEMMLRDVGEQLSRKSGSNDALNDFMTVDSRSLLTNCTYLEDSLVNVMGLKVYGTPWQPAFCYWAFNLRRGRACLEKWNLIPANVDVLISHSPPLGHGDLNNCDVRCGCVELLHSVRHRIKPKFHVFGHIHEGYGCTTDGFTTFINASTCDVSGRPINAPVIFDIPLPRLTKAEDAQF